jgi:hypothetical protein
MNQASLTREADTIVRDFFGGIVHATVIPRTPWRRKHQLREVRDGLRTPVARHESHLELCMEVRQP